MISINIKYAHLLSGVLVLAMMVIAGVWRYDPVEDSSQFPQLGDVIENPNLGSPLVTIQSNQSNTNQIAIDEQEFLTFALRQHPVNKPLTEQEKNALLQQLVQQKLMLLEAKKHQVEQRFLVKQSIETILLQSYQRYVLDKELESFAISEEKLQTYYDDNKEQFLQPAMVKVSLLQIKHNAQNKQQKEQLATQLQQSLANNPTQFEQTVLQHSDDYRSHQNQGSIPWMIIGEKPRYWDKSIMQEASKLDQNNPISSLISLVDSWVILKWQDSRPAYQIPFEQVKNTIKQNKLQQKRNQWMAEYWQKLADDYRIEINNYQLANTNFQIPDNTQQPPPSPQ